MKYGDKERALDCPEVSGVSRTWIESDPDLAPLRDHPRYKAIVVRLAD